MYNTILVGLDGSLAAEAALWELEKLLAVQPANVILLTVEPTVDFAEVEEEMQTSTSGEIEALAENSGLLTYRSEARLRHYLKSIAQRLEKVGAKTTIEISFRKPSDEILFYCRRYNVDLIVMATHGRKGLNRLLHGSVTESVLHRSKCPLLVMQMPETPFPRYALNAEAAPA